MYLSGREAALAFFAPVSEPALASARHDMDTASRATGLPVSDLDVEVLTRVKVSGARRIYSAGISTAGVFEWAAASSGSCRVVATTIDEDGLRLTEKKIRQASSAVRDGDAAVRRINVRLEDFSKPLPWPSNCMDVVYQRLGLHYLDAADRRYAINNFARLARPNGPVVIAVRSAESIMRRLEAKDPTLKSWDPESGQLEIRRPDGSILVQTRHLPTAEELTADIQAAGLKLEGDVRTRMERTYEDYGRTIGGDPDYVLFAIARKPAA